MNMRGHVPMKLYLWILKFEFSVTSMCQKILFSFIRFHPVWDPPGFVGMSVCLIVERGLPAFTHQIVHIRHVRFFVNQLSPSKAVKNMIPILIFSNHTKHSGDDGCTLM